MKIERKTLSRRVRSQTFKSMVAGVGSVNFDQSMIHVKRHVQSGSIEADWRMIGRDISNAIAAVKRDKEAA
jgi:hypothetical protein